MLAAKLQLVSDKPVMTCIIDLLDSHHPFSAVLELKYYLKK
jgi:hypothetical protein